MTTSVYSSVVHAPRKMSALVLSALGVVFGDIGTSPLYALREAFLHVTEGGRALVESDVLQVLSLVFWALMLVVSTKYLLFIMRADNKGEGGLFALLALVPERFRHGPKRQIAGVAVLVVLGSSLLYGDGAITPAISVLSAVEGIAVARPELSRFVVPVTLAIIFGLFWIQKRGTRSIGTFFGPVCLLWFGTIGALGAVQIVKNPAVLQALSPHHAVGYFVQHGFHGIFILGAVFLAVTGGEALYADMGHFGGPAPIRRGWVLVVAPALVLSYFGQGALALRDPSTVSNLFYEMVPKGAATFALAALASAATVIASQAMISGAFSLTRQAMQLGFFPRVTIKHTAAEQEGQIYIPEVNWLIGLACLLLVVGFRSSAALAAAYGIAVSATMLITTCVFVVVVATRLGWRKRAVALAAMFIALDVPFVIANGAKFMDGGWVPVVLAISITVVMLVWYEGRRLIAESYLTRFKSFDDVWPIIQATVAQRVAGTGVFMASMDKGVPPILVHLAERTLSLHKQIVLLTVVTQDQPIVEPRDRLQIEEIGHGFWRVRLNFGFMQQPDVPRGLNLALRRQLLPIDEERVTYYLARERILARPGGQMPLVLEMLFSFLVRNAVNADRYFQIPPEKVIEVGAQIDL
ncbi:MAG: KUP/HAK/KT family potassium transporter [Deltaproteobacteria bacterium]|nr:KUP/HAK/KT family potassium transporter [Deltaproteobacteria bacterium]